MKKRFKIYRKMDTPENKAFWATFEKAAEEVKKLPEHMRPPKPPTINVYDFDKRGK